LSDLEERKYDYIINCIGILKNGDKEKMCSINSDFPKTLDRFCVKNKIKLIHISTDAVFSNFTDAAYEDTKPNPSDYYGRTKLAGEVKQGLNIRTSVLGFDPIEHKGL